MLTLWCSFRHDAAECHGQNEGSQEFKRHHDTEIKSNLNSVQLLFWVVKNFDFV